MKGCYIAHAIVHPAWRTSPLFIDLALAVAKRARDDGRRWMFIGTATARKAGEEEQFISAYGSVGFKVWRQDAAVPGIGKGTAMLLDLDEAMADPKSLVGLYLGAEAAGA
ncbi:MAG: hypothetical protein GY788_06535 [bacterium]|nr:hypothetical protein [bacterium]